MLLVHLALLQLLPVIVVVISSSAIEPVHRMKITINNSLSASAVVCHAQHVCCKRYSTHS
jgi:hypothetical protein